MPETLLETEGLQDGVFRREAPTQPYPGLRSFGRNEAALFFGRKKSVGRLLEILQRTRFLAVLGPSGSGKSSLVRTGLFEALEGGLDLIAGSRWLMVDIAHPADRPFHALAASMIQATTGEAAPDKAAVEALAQDLRRGPRSLIEWSQAGGLPAGHNLLVLVDQFEEMFRSAEYAAREEVEAFVDLLIESSRGSEAPIYVVMTMRSEYVGAGSQIHNLGETMTRGMYITPWMTRDECKLAITGPAKLMRFEIEPGLVNRLLNDIATFAPQDDDAGIDAAELMARQSDQLPLMQHLLNLLWREGREAAPAGKLTLRRMDYDQLGGLSGAMDVHAERVFNALGKDARKVAEDVFRAIITGSSVATAVRRPRRFGDLVEECACDPALVVEVVEAFRAPDCSFLTPPPPARLTDDLIIDISHESIIRQWARLRGWIDAEATAAGLWPLLLTQAREHREKKGELLTGRTLELRGRWWAEDRPNKVWASRYGGNFELVDAYLKASRTAERRRRLMLALVPIGLATVLISGAATALAVITQRADSERRRLEEARGLVVAANSLLADLKERTKASEEQTKRATEASSAAEARALAARKAAEATVKSAELARLSLAAEKVALTEEKGRLELRLTDLRRKNAVWQRQEVAVAARNFDVATMYRVAEETRTTFEEGSLAADDHSQVIWSWVVSGQAEEILVQNDRATRAFDEAFKQAEQTRAGGLDSPSLRQSRGLAGGYYAGALLRSGEAGEPPTDAQARKALAAAEFCIDDLAEDQRPESQALLIRCWAAAGLAKAYLREDFGSAFDKGKTISLDFTDKEVIRSRIHLYYKNIEALKLVNSSPSQKDIVGAEFESEGDVFRYLYIKSAYEKSPIDADASATALQTLANNTFDEELTYKWSDAYERFNDASSVRFSDLEELSFSPPVALDRDIPILAVKANSLLNDRIEFGEPGERLAVSLGVGSLQYYANAFEALSRKMAILDKLPVSVRAEEESRVELQLTELSKDIRSSEFGGLLLTYPSLMSSPDFLTKNVGSACADIGGKFPRLAGLCAEIQDALGKQIPAGATDRDLLREHILKAKEFKERLWKRDENDVALNGYDVVAYFDLPQDGAAVRGDTKYAYPWQGAVWLFSSETNRNRFKEKPSAFAPQYAGASANWIRFGLFDTADPRAWLVRDGKLYLFGRVGARESWDVESVIAADKNWPEVQRSTLEIATMLAP